MADAINLSGLRFCSCVLVFCLSSWLFVRFRLVLRRIQSALGVELGSRWSYTGDCRTHTLVLILKLVKTESSMLDTLYKVIVLGNKTDKHANISSERIQPRTCCCQQLSWCGWKSKIIMSNNVVYWFIYWYNPIKVLKEVFESEEWPKSDVFVY